MCHISQVEQLVHNFRTILGRLTHIRFLLFIRKKKKQWWTINEWKLKSHKEAQLFKKREKELNTQKGTQAKQTPPHFTPKETKKRKILVIMPIYEVNQINKWKNKIKRQQPENGLFQVEVVVVVKWNLVRKQSKAKKTGQWVINLNTNWKEKCA